MTDLSLTDAARQMGWSRKSLVRKLAQHGVDTYGSGRLERITAANLERLKVKESRWVGRSLDRRAGRKALREWKSRRAKTLDAMLRGCT